MNRETARQAILRLADEMNARRTTYWDGSTDPEVTLWEEATQTKAYGWVFLIQSIQYLETGDFRDMLVGNGGYIVRHDRGEIHVLGSAHSLDEYETGRAPFEIIPLPED